MSVERKIRPDMEFVGGLDKALYEVLKLGTDEQLRDIHHGGWNATFKMHEKVLWLMLERIAIERGIDYRTMKPREVQKA